MDLTPWNPWQEIERVQSEVAHLLSAALSKLRTVVPGRPIAFVPVMDVVEVGEEYRLYLSLPGMVEEDIDITLEGHLLIVRGEREPPFDEARSIVHHRQWKHGYFERRVQLPERIDGEAISASYESGVLTIRIPKSHGTVTGETAKAKAGSSEDPAGKAPPSGEEPAR